MAPNKPLAVLVDGQPLSSATDWPLDRGLHYGDGLFETMVARGGHIRFVFLHRARLAVGCARLRINLPHQPLWERADALAQQYGNVVLKLLVTRGAMTQRGYGISGDEPGRWLLFVYPGPDTDSQPSEVTVVTLQARMGENAALAGIKHCNRLEQVLARMELGADAFEGLMGSSSGHLISGTMSNVFLDTDVGLVTPSLQLCGIAGVTRAVVLARGRSHGNSRESRKRSDGRAG